VNTPAVRVVVPRLVDCGERDRLWRWCAQRWADFDVVEGFESGDGPFNRARAINRAASTSAGQRWDVLVIIDADIVIDVGRVQEAVRQAADTDELVVPFDRRWLLNERATVKALDSAPSTARPRESVWRHSAQPDPNSGHCSSVNVVSQPLWNRVGGFDERFVGWGGEDDAFVAACAAMSGVRRIVGDVYHLHHAASPERAHRAPLYVANRLLAERYVAAAGSPRAMRRILDEKARGCDTSTVVVVTTTGPRLAVDAVADHRLRSLQFQLPSGAVDRWLICVDNEDPDMVERVAAAHPDWEVAHTGVGAGYAAAMRGAREAALASGQPWVFWSEDDFIFDERIPLLSMQLAMPQRMAQLSLMRQAWYLHEVEAGGVVEAAPESFTPAGPMLAHRAYWTQNPHLTRRLQLAREWPQRRDSEALYGRKVFEDPRAICGIWGPGRPMVTHVGDEQAGSGY